MFWLPLARMPVHILRRMVRDMAIWPSSRLPQFGCGVEDVTACLSAISLRPLGHPLLELCQIQRLLSILLLKQGNIFKWYFDVDTLKVAVAQREQVCLLDSVSLLQDIGRNLTK